MREKEGAMKKFVMMSSALALGVATPISVAAQDSPAAEASEGDIVVTARRQSENIRDIPDSIQAFGSDTLEQAGVTSVNDLSGLVSGFHVVEAQQPGVVLINIRGIGQVRFGEAPIAVVIDGVQQSSPNQITQDLFDIEQIEFLKGPQGALYGRNALGGAINIVTKKPGDDFEGSVKASYASGDEYKIRGVISTPIGEAAGLRLGASYRNRDGQIYNSTLDTNVDYDETLSLRGSLLLHPSSAVTIDFSGSYLDQKAGAAYYKAGAPNESREPVIANILGVGKRKLGDGSIKIEAELGGATLQSVTAYSSVDSLIYEDLEWTPLDLLAASQTLKLDAITQEVRLSSGERNDRLRWVVGLYYLHTKQKVVTTLFGQPALTGLPDPLPLALLASKDNNNAYAAFGQVVFALSEQVDLTGALRYDIDDRSQRDLNPASPTDPTLFEKTFHSLQPKVSLAYKFPNGGLAYATIAKGFRSGGFNNNAVVTRQFEKEELWNYELGFKTVLADRKLFVNGAIFYTPIDDRQVYGLDLSQGAAQFIANPIPKSHIVGAELEITAIPVADLHLTFGGTLLDTKIDDYDPSVFAGTLANGDYEGNKLNQVPQWSVNAAVQYSGELPNGAKIIPRFDISGSGGDFYWEIDNVARRNAVWVANARLTYQSDRFELSLFANNLFDTQYDIEFVPAAFSGITTGQGIGARNAPRQIGIGGTVRF